MILTNMPEEVTLWWPLSPTTKLIQVVICLLSYF